MGGNRQPAGDGRVLFVATKRQAWEGIAEAAKRAAQYLINHRWLGGTLCSKPLNSTLVVANFKRCLV